MLKKKNPTKISNTILSTCFMQANRVSQQISTLHLYEFVSAPQAVRQSPALGLLVVFVVLPESLGLLLLPLLLPQLLPRVFELSSQRRNHAVVSLLLLLVAKGESTSSAVIYLSLRLNDGI